MPAPLAIAEATLKAIRENVVVIGVSDSGERVLVLVEPRGDSDYDYVPVATLRQPLQKAVNE